MKTIDINVKEVRKIFNNFTWDYIDSIEFRYVDYLIFNSFGGGVNSDTFEFELKERGDYYDEMGEDKIREEVLENLRELNNNLMDSEEYQEYQERLFYDDLAEISLEVNDKDIVNKTLEKNNVNELELIKCEYQIQYPNQYQKDLIYCHDLDLSFELTNETFKICYHYMSFGDYEFSDKFEIEDILQELDKDDTKTINSFIFIKDNYEKFKTIYKEIDEEITYKLGEELSNLKSEYGI
ncbi:hypothetical protein [uncultured Tissierella sp.]|uniref:hypothetical protein n=1 Tax=uncultured Tissierella sp. TaxID=448160 RepID=UPI002804D620|nr:hypothetical protein [uncultured Tissierella sp.]MDU5080543.1 hypothetical protein [Bacillota bacterium]